MRRRKTRYLVLCSICFYIIAVANAKTAMFVLCWTTVSLTCVAWATARFSASGIRLARAGLPARLTAGELLPCGLNITNQGSLPRSNLVVEDRLENQTRGLVTGRTALVPWLSGGAAVAVDQAGEPAGRGAHRIGPATLVTADPIGLFEHRRAIPGSEAEVLVWPRIEPLTEVRFGSGDDGRGPIARRAGAGFDFRSLRDYQDGDDLRHVDWKSTAHLGRLQIREFELHDTPAATVVLDLCADAFADSSDGARLEQAVSTAGSIAVRLAAQGLETRLIADDGLPVSVRVGPGSAPEALLDCLARVTGGGRQPVAELLGGEAWRLNSGDRLVVVSADPDPALPRRLAALAGEGHPVLWIALGAGPTAVVPGVRRVTLAAGGSLAAALAPAEVAA